MDPPVMEVEEPRTMKENSTLGQNRYRFNIKQLKN